MKINKLVLGPFGTNCYILSKDGKAIIIDPADDANEIINYCKDLNVIEILVTHHHFDHIGALEDVEKHYNLKHNDFKYTFGYEVIKTPGHTSDSISFYFKDIKVLFGGDFIFYRSIGRFDFPESSAEDMMTSLKMIESYPDDITIYPGHGPSTLLGSEKEIFSYYFNRKR